MVELLILDNDNYMEKMKIEIWSDIACPYCYIGKRKLDKVLLQFPYKDEIELVWHSYELNPDLPKKALTENYLTYYANKFELSIDEAKQEFAKLTSLAKESGLNYHFEKLVVANTSDALRLAKLAKKYNLATETEEVLFKAYFTDGLDISDKNVLIKLGVEAGLKQDEVESLLAGDEYKSEIEKDIRYSEDNLNLEYIPFYLFNNKMVIQGSLPDQDYVNVLWQAYDDWKVNGVSKTIDDDIISGQSCSIDGKCS